MARNKYNFKETLIREMKREKKISDAVDHLDQAMGGVTLIKKFIEMKGISMDSDVAPRLFAEDKVESIGEMLNLLSHKLSIISDEYKELKGVLTHKPNKNTK